MNDAFYDEKLADIKEAIDVVFRFQLYRRGKIDEYEDGGKRLGDCIDVLLGACVEYQKIMEENKTLKEMLNKIEDKVKELKEENKKAIEKLSNETNSNNYNRTRKNGENDTQCLSCKEYDKQQGMCRWGECAWYSRKPMCFDMRYCCKTCAFDIDEKCNYLKEQDKREKQMNNK